MEDSSFITLLSKCLQSVHHMVSAGVYWRSIAVNFSFAGVLEIIRDLMVFWLLVQAKKDREAADARMAGQ